MPESLDQPDDRTPGSAPTPFPAQPAPAPPAPGGHLAPPYPYPYPYPGGYPPPYPGYGPPPAARNGMGVAALVTAVLGLLASPSVFGGVVLGAVAVVLGVAGRGRAKRGEADNGGVAIAGVVLGALAIATGIAFIAIYFGVFKSSGGEDYIHCMDRAGPDPISQQKCADRFREQFENKFSVTLTPAPPAR